MQSKKSVKVFEARDLVIPILDLPVPCPIKVEIDDDRVSLFMGNRTIEWDKQTGEIIESRINETPAKTNVSLKPPSNPFPEK